MSRVWEIIESTRADHRQHSEEDKVMKAYECGYEEGYEDAMKEAHSQMGERSYRINDQYTGKDPGSWSEPMSERRGSMSHRDASDFRESMRYRMAECMNERRGRDSMGRFR